MRQSQEHSTQKDRWVKPFFKQYRAALCLALFLGLLTFIFAGALMFTSGYLISRAAEMPGNIAAIFIPVMLVRVFGVGKPLLQYLERLTSHDWVLRMTSKLRLKLYTVIEKDAIFFRTSHRTGDILGLLAEDIGHIQNLYLRTIFPTIIGWLVYLLLILALGLFSLWFALVMFLIIGVTVIFLPLVSVLVNRAQQARRKAMKNELYSELTDNILGVSDWVFSQRGSEYQALYKKSEQVVRDSEKALNRFSRIRDLALQIVFGIAAVLILLWAGNHFGGSFGGAANWIAAFVIGFFPLIDAFAPLSEAATDTNIYRDSIKRLNELPEEEESSQPFQTELVLPLNIEIKDLRFRYSEDSKTVLNDLTMSISQGEKIAILGRSGSGKSTLASLIRGDLTPTQGTVTINGIPSIDFGDAITNYIGVIQQQTYLFNGTLFYNLRIGNANASEEEIWEVLNQVGLKDMVEKLPDKLDTMVDEAGLRFSGGERHRIALARVLLQDVPIIILDEPTVGLDPLTERALLDTFFRTMEDKTIIMITHHLQGVSRMDRVVFIEDGTLSMSGSPLELEKSNAHYQRLQAFDKGISG